MKHTPDPQTGPQPDQTRPEPDPGNITPAGLGVDLQLPEGLPLARVRDGETRKQTWERLRREARTAGINRKYSVIYAGREVERLYPPDPPSDDPAPDDPPGQNPQVVDRIEDTVSKAQSFALLSQQTGVTGLGDIPANWPVLPPNASLQAEIAWVQASRLDVVRETPQGTVVDLSRAVTPAPSRAAIGWLETSIRAYSKYCDIAARATQTQEHEAEQVRRERMSIDEIRALLREMLPPQN